MLRLPHRHGNVTSAEDELTVLAAHDLLGCRARLVLRTDAKVADASGANVKQAAVDFESSVADRLLDHDIAQQDRHAGLDVQLGDADRPLLLVLDGGELFSIGESHRLQRREPCVQHTTDPGVPERRRRAAASRMATQNYVFDLEVDYGVLDDGRRVDVGSRDDVGNVAVDKDISGLQAEDCCLRAAGVGAAEPDCERDLEVRKKNRTTIRRGNS